MLYIKYLIIVSGHNIKQISSENLLFFFAVEGGKRPHLLKEPSPKIYAGLHGLRANNLYNLIHVFQIRNSGLPVSFWPKT